LDHDPATGFICSPEGSELAKGTLAIGMVKAEDKSWSGSADYNFRLERIANPPIVAPEGLEIKQYALTGEDYIGAFVNVGFDGNDVYVQGIFDYLPDAWVKGTISGDKVIFANKQYLGVDPSINRHCYLISATYEELTAPYSGRMYSLADEDIVFDYDAGSQTLSNSSCFLVNGGKDEPYGYIPYNLMRMALYTGEVGTLVPPTWKRLNEHDHQDYYNWGGLWGRMEFGLPTTDAEGNYLNRENMSVAIYARVNGEVVPMRFMTEDYDYIEADMTELPFGYNDLYSYLIYGWGTEMTVYYYTLGPEAYGLQTVYRADGEELRSDIAWKEVTTIGTNIQPDAAHPAYPEVDTNDVGPSILCGYRAEDTTSWGVNKRQTYDVATKLDDAALVGTHIDEITIPLKDVASLTDVKVWLSSQLRVEDSKNVPDLVCLDVTPTDDGLFTVTLPKPYIIPEGGVYVGYSITVPEVSSPSVAQPIVTIPESNPNGFYIHTSDRYLKWMDLSDLLTLTAPIQVAVSGKEVRENAVGVKTGDLAYAEVGKPFETEITFVNHGVKGVQSIDVEYTVDGTTTTDHVDLDTPVEGAFGLTFKAMASLPAISAKGYHDLNVNITKVNGVENEDKTTPAATPVLAMINMPKHRVLLEEYTGTWCGWCVRGLFALEKLRELYPDEYVCVSYHNEDPMEIMPYYLYPSDFSGYPSANIDRTGVVDPFWGADYGVKEMGVVDNMDYRARTFGMAEINLEPQLDLTNNVVNVNTSVNFAVDANNIDYSLEYILLEDGLTGPAGSKWDQANSYPGYDYPKADMLQPYIDGEGTLSGVVFNDVAVMKSANGGEKGSIPQVVKADEPISHTYTFNLSNAFNSYGEYIIQDKEQLRVVVLLVNNKTREVVNANQMQVDSETLTAIDESLNSDISSVEYFDLSGRKIDKAGNGVCIMRINYSNGMQKNIKMLRK
jgi:hypothetical protein